MAVIRYLRYPGRFNNPTPEQPQGAFKNRTAPGVEDGSYLEADWLNDISGFLSYLLTHGDITPSGTADTAVVSQYAEALRNITSAQIVAAITGLNLSTTFVPQTRKINNQPLTNDITLPGLGIGQTWQNVLPNRAPGVTYTNNTPSPIMLSLVGRGTNESIPAKLSVGGVEISEFGASSTAIINRPLSVVVPAGATYLLTTPVTLISWSELR